MPSMWEQLPDETDLAYQAFQVYLDLPSPRSYQDCASRLNKSYSLISRWGGENGWVSRAASYDMRSIGVISVAERDIALEGFQISILKDAYLDYGSLRGLWIKMFEQLSTSDDFTPRELKDLIAARAQLDTMARRTARMPGVYTAKEEDAVKDRENNTYFLDPNSGPIAIESEIKRG